MDDAIVEQPAVQWHIRQSGPHRLLLPGPPRRPTPHQGQDQIIHPEQPTRGSSHWRQQPGGPSRGQHFPVTRGATSARGRGGHRSSSNLLEFSRPPDGPAPYRHWGQVNPLNFGPYHDENGNNLRIPHLPPIVPRRPEPARQTHRGRGGYSQRGNHPDRNGSRTSQIPRNDNNHSQSQTTQRQGSSSHGERPPFTITPVLPAVSSSREQTTTTTTSSGRDRQPPCSTIVETAEPVSDGAPAGTAATTTVETTAHTTAETTAHTAATTSSTARAGRIILRLRRPQCGSRAARELNGMQPPDFSSRTRSSQQQQSSSTPSFWGLSQQQQSSSQTSSFWGPSGPFRSLDESDDAAEAKIQARAVPDEDIYGVEDDYVPPASRSTPASVSSSSTAQENQTSASIFASASTPATSSASASPSTSPSSSPNNSTTTLSSPLRNRRTVIFTSSSRTTAPSQFSFTLTTPQGAETPILDITRERGPSGATVVVTRDTNIPHTQIGYWATRGEPGRLAVPPRNSTRAVRDDDVGDPEDDDVEGFGGHDLYVNLVRFDASSFRDRLADAGAAGRIIDLFPGIVPSDEKTKLSTADHVEELKNGAGGKNIKECTSTKTSVSHRSPSYSQLPLPSMDGDKEHDLSSNKGILSNQSFSGPRESASKFAPSSISNKDEEAGLQTIAHDPSHRRQLVNLLSSTLPSLPIS